MHKNWCKYQELHLVIMIILIILSTVLISLKITSLLCFFCNFDYERKRSTPVIFTETNDKNGMPNLVDLQLICHNQNNILVGNQDVKSTNC